MKHYVVTSSLPCRDIAKTISHLTTSCHSMLWRYSLSTDVATREVGRQDKAFVFGKKKKCTIWYLCQSFQPKLPIFTLNYHFHLIQNIPKHGKQVQTSKFNFLSRHSLLIHQLNLNISISLGHTNQIIQIPMSYQVFE